MPIPILIAKEIPIGAARRIAESYHYDQVIIIARKVGIPGVHPGTEHVTTFGTTKEHCSIAANIGRLLKYKIMGWKILDKDLPR